MITVGWILTALPAVLALYAYVLYPALLAVLARRPRRRTAGLAELPLVSMVVPAYNEETQIRGAIEALIAQNYPADRRQILILSDASTDRTDEIVREYLAQGVELLRMPIRGGKTAAENASIHVLRGDIVVNSDSSVRLQRDAIRHLVNAMSDPRVGVASTRDVSVSAGDASVNTTEAGYVNYEMRVRRLETDTGGIVGASGSGYAIRATLHRLPVRADLSRDFSAALTARLNNYSTVSVDEAVCFVPRTTSLATEYRRKVRTIARGIETLMHNKQLLDPTQFGVFAWKLLSHKVCRWLLPPAAALGLVGLLTLSFVNRWAIVALAAVAVVLVAAGVAAVVVLRRPVPRLISALAFGAAANLAVLHALIRVWHGHEDHMWEPTRRTSAVA